MIVSNNSKYIGMKFVSVRFASLANLLDTSIQSSIIWSLCYHYNNWLANVFLIPLGIVFSYMAVISIITLAIFSFHKKSNIIVWKEEDEPKFSLSPFGYSMIRNAKTVTEEVLNEAESITRAI